MPLEDGEHVITAQIGDGLAPGTTYDFDLVADTGCVEPGKLIINSAYDQMVLEQDKYVANAETSKDNTPPPPLEGTAKPGVVLTIP